jgi:hypothetical protein
MGTRELGWSAAKFSAVRFLALTLSVSAVALALPARAADQKKARDKIVELNKQALLSYEAKDFETAKELLTKALKEARQAGLDDDKMTARTYLHLGAVHWVGFQDQTVALQNFALAKKIRPDIQLTPSIETADLKSLFDLAAAEPEPEAAAVKTSTPARPQPQPQPQPRTANPRLSGDDSGEPDLPATMSAPLMCSVPDLVPPGKDLSIRCALKPGLNGKVVQLHHRAPGVEAYQILPMKKSAKGWYVATLPGHAMTVGNLQVYFDARDASDNVIASNGQVDSPSIIEIRKKGAAKVATECSADDPMCRLRREAKDAAYEAGLHRRREGAVWFGVGGGAGWGFAPAGKLEWEKDIQVSAITTTTGLFHLLPELGYMYSDTFGLAIQARWEFFKQQQITTGGPPGEPTTQALAGFARAIWYTDLSNDGNFELSYSADIGGGFIRFPVKPVVVYEPSSDPSQPPVADKYRTIFKTDTRQVGPFLAGASVGFIYHVSRRFALALDGRFVTGAPAFGAVLEAGLSAQLAFGGTKGPAMTDDEGEGGGPEPANDAPPAAESTSEEED